MKGKVDWFNNGAGYGRATNASGTRYHIHFANIMTLCGFRTLAPGEEVEFTVVQGTDGKIAEAKEIKRSDLQTPLDPNAPRERFEKMPWAIEVEIEKNGEVSFPQLTQTHPRDHKENHVDAFYLGHPGSFEKHNPFAVNMPWKEVNYDAVYGDVAVYIVNEEGGIVKDRAKPNFKPGHYVVTIQVSGNSVAVSAKKISLRTQDSRYVVHPDGKGVWLVYETPYLDTLEIPQYEVGRKAEQELKKKIEALIPAEFEWPTADHRKFAKAIARGIVAISQNQ